MREFDGNVYHGGAQCCRCTRGESPGEYRGRWVRAMLQRDAALSDEYNHNCERQMGPHDGPDTHRLYAWNDPPANVMPAVSWIQVPEAGSLGVEAEGATSAAGRRTVRLIAGDNRFGLRGNANPETVRSRRDAGEVHGRDDVRRGSCRQKVQEPLARRSRWSCFAWTGARCLRTKTVRMER